MSRIPNIDCQGVQKIYTNANSVIHLGDGGQKRVFGAEIDGHPCVLKFVKISECPFEDEDENSQPAEIVRIEREVQVIERCTSRYMVKAGPISLQQHQFEGELLVAYSEEFIDDGDLNERYVKPKNRMDASLVAKLGLHIADAIECLWGMNFVHRDIKPGNIMRRSNGEFVLLDAGLSLDQAADTISTCPVGTPIYFAPEQWDFSKRRELDFRTDLFSLGVTMYQLYSGQHPFWDRRFGQIQVQDRIQNHTPENPSVLISQENSRLDRVIMRLLAKQQHLRYREVSHLKKDLAAIEQAG